MNLETDTKKIIAIITIIILTIIGWILHLTMGGSGFSLDQTYPLILGQSEEKTIEEGKMLYSQYCASCHGENLEGQKNWRQPLPNGRLPAPPHDKSGHTWHHPDKVLFMITKFGPAAVLQDPSYQSDMPAFKGQLSDQEIIAILSYIKSRWPGEIQRKQKEISKSEISPNNK